jgi:putative glycosyltransferase (TIGR04348 family)
LITRICLVTPAPRGSRKGNRITALRWAAILRRLGRQVVVREQYRGERCDLLIALHAKRSYPSVQRYRDAHPDAPLIVALTGTDLYGSIHTDAGARRSLELATRLVVLQPLGVDELPPKVRARTRVIFQSVPRIKTSVRPRPDSFDVCVLGHLRPVKDPFRTAMASRWLPATSRLRVLQVGAALSEPMAKRALGEARRNPRYTWLGELPRWKALRVLARCRLLVLTSRMEGGANVISEAVAASIPVISSRIAGSIGLLGDDYPGYFSVGDTRALTNLLQRAETDASFYRMLRQSCARLRSLIDPASERRRWQLLLRELETANHTGDAGRGPLPLGLQQL